MTPDFDRFIIPPSAVSPNSPRGRRNPPGKHVRNDGRSALPKPADGEKFIAVNMSWFAAASALPGKTLAVGMVIWWLVTMNKCRDEFVAFSYSSAACLGVADETIRQAIRRLEDAKLIAVLRGAGRCPRIQVLSVPALAKPEKDNSTSPDGPS